MKIWWLSATPYTRSGYGVQTHVACRGLGLAGHDVSVIATNRPQEGMSVVWELPNGRLIQSEGRTDFGDLGAKKLYKIYPHGIGTQKEVESGDTSWMMGAKMLELMLQVNKPDVIISLQDTQNVLFIGQATNAFGIPWLHWLPWDNIAWEPDMTKFCMEAQCQIVAMSDFAEKIMQDAKFPYIGKIYHGVNTKVYKPIDKPKPEIRKELGFDDVDKFLIGYVGANEERKHPDILIDAYAQFSKKHPDARLFMHTDIQESYPAHYSYNIIPMVQKEDIDETFRHTSRAHYFAKFSDQTMAQIYNSIDILASTTSGEGFGLMALYGNACGTPTAITDTCTAQQLLGRGKWGFPVKPTATYVAPGGYKRQLTNAEEMGKALEFAYNNRDKLKEMGRLAREDSLKYDQDIIGEQWAHLVEKEVKP